MEESWVEIYAFRHGQTDWNAEGRVQGHLDVPLNTEGRRQAEALAPRLVALKIQSILSSDLNRANGTPRADRHRDPWRRFAPIAVTRLGQRRIPGPDPQRNHLPAGVCPNVRKMEIAGLAALAVKSARPKPSGLQNPARPRDR